MDAAASQGYQVEQVGDAVEHAESLRELADLRGLLSSRRFVSAAIARHGKYESGTQRCTRKNGENRRSFSDCSLDIFTGGGCLSSSNDEREAKKRTTSENRAPLVKEPAAMAVGNGGTRGQALPPKTKNTHNYGVHTSVSYIPCPHLPKNNIFKAQPY